MCAHVEYCTHLYATLALTLTVNTRGYYSAQRFGKHHFLCACGDHVFCESSTGEIFKAGELLVRIITLSPLGWREMKRRWRLKCFLEALIDRYPGENKRSLILSRSIVVIFTNFLLILILSICWILLSLVLT